MNVPFSYIYVDVSASTRYGYDPEYTAKLESALRKRPERVFAFGTSVVPWKDRASVSRGGTSYGNVDQHLISIGPRVGRSLVLTDSPNSAKAEINAYGVDVLDIFEWLDEQGGAADVAHSLSELRDRIDEVGDELASALSKLTDKTRLTARAIELHTKLQRIRRELDALRPQLHTVGHSAEWNDLEERMLGVVNTMLVHVFAVDPAEAMKASKSAKKGEPVKTAPWRVALTCEEFVTDDVASVRMSLAVGADMHTVEAHAKRDQHDIPDPETGRKLAYGRALRKLGSALVVQGNERVQAADRARRQAEAKKAQARGEQRRAERERRQLITDGEAIHSLVQALKAKDNDYQKLQDYVERQDRELQALRSAEEARKQRAIKKRVATRKANAAAKTRPTRKR